MLKRAIIKAFKQTSNSVIEFAGELSKKKISVFASCTSYFLFSSIPPFIILMSMLLPRFGLSVGELVKMVTDVTPDDLDYQVTLIIQDAFARSGSVVPLTLVFMIWTAANSIAALSEGLRVAYGVRRQRRYLAFRLLSIVYTFSVILLLTAYMLISMFGEKIMGIIGWNKLKLPKFLMMVLNWHNLFFLLVGFTMVLFIYVFLSGRKLSIRYHVFGTIFTIIAWELFSIIFSAYLKLSTNRSVIYGSFSALVALLLWIYIAICILLAGGTLNQYIHREDELEETELRRERRRARTSHSHSPAPERLSGRMAAEQSTDEARGDLRETEDKPTSRVISGKPSDPAEHTVAKRPAPTSGKPQTAFHLSKAKAAQSRSTEIRIPNKPIDENRQYAFKKYDSDTYMPHSMSTNTYGDEAYEGSLFNDSAYGKKAYQNDVDGGYIPDIDDLADEVDRNISQEKAGMSFLANIKIKLADVGKNIAPAVRKLADALAGFWFNIIIANWNKIVVKWWNEASTNGRTSAIKNFWNDVIVRNWNDVAVKKIFMPISSGLRSFMENFKHFDDEEW